MSILLDTHDEILIQGITGTEGSKSAREMSAYGANIVAGVTPGKGGSSAENIPVFDTVKEAMARFPNIRASLIVVPAKFAREAAEEAIESCISLVVILTENISVFDTAYLLALARKNKVQMIGPSSIGIISPGKVKIGSIGSGGIDRKVFTPGRIGVISKSGGMTSEIAHTLCLAGFGQSSVVGIGGEMILGSSFRDIARLFEEDAETDALVICGEIGGEYEEQLADAMVLGEITKPVVALIAGVFAESLGLPQGTVLGHAGAMVSKGRGSFHSKVEALWRAGAYVASIPEDIPDLLKLALR